MLLAPQPPPLLARRTARSSPRRRAYNVAGRELLTLHSSAAALGTQTPRQPDDGRPPPLTSPTSEAAAEQAVSHHPDLCELWHACRRTHTRSSSRRPPPRTSACRTPVPAELMLALCARAPPCPHYRAHALPHPCCVSYSRAAMANQRRATQCELLRGGTGEPWHDLLRGRCTTC